jgi:hypothetical protein
MDYIHKLPDYPALEKLFNDEGYKLEVDLSNSIIIEKNDNQGYWIEYDELPENLKLALNEFSEKNNLDN